MASYYVRSSAAGAGTGADWTNAYTTLVTALSGKVAGDIFYIAQDHAESAASLVLTSPGTAAAPCLFYCVNHAGAVPPAGADLATGATFSTTTNGNITINGSAYYYGLSFTAGNSTGTPLLTMAATGANTQAYENCTFAMGSTGGGAFVVGNSGSVGGVECRHSNCTFSFSGTLQRIEPCCTWTWDNKPGSAALLGAQVPTTLFSFSTSTGVVVLRGLDLSAAGSGKTLVGATTGGPGSVLIEDCKLNASVTIQATPNTPGRTKVDVVRSDSGSTNYRYDRIRYEGTLTIETTIVRTGGASDGTTPIAWQIDTTANAKWHQPFVSPPIAIWNETTGSPVTATIEGIWGGGAVPNDDDIWVEVQYLGTSGFPVASFVNDSKANALTTAAGQTSSAETWGGSTTEFKLHVSFTPQKEGWIYARVKAAKASSTFYVDPKITLT